MLLLVVAGQGAAIAAPVVFVGRVLMGMWMWCQYTHIGACGGRERD